MFQFGGIGASFGGLSPHKPPWRRDCPCTYRGLRASAHRVNVRSFPYILSGLNHYWNVKWTMKRSLHHCDHIIKLII